MYRRLMQRKQSSGSSECSRPVFSPTFQAAASSSTEALRRVMRRSWNSGLAGEAGMESNVPRYSSITINASTQKDDVEKAEQ